MERLKIYSFLFLLILWYLIPVNCIAQKFNGIAETPPMGWNSWNCFREDVNEFKVKAVADAMVSSGMREAGYRYIIIDDGWMTDERDENGHIIVNKSKFPGGMKALGDYIHSLGLKFGIYSAPGRFTCQKLMGSLGYEQIDANDYASWGVDYLKYDWCQYPKTREEAKNTSQEECRAAFELMRDCLYNTGRPIFFSIHDEGCGREGAVEWAKDIAHSRRSGGDIKDNWERMLYCLESVIGLENHAGPGFWNDPDMLEVGNMTKERLWGNISDVKMTNSEYKTHFSMWCMVAAPLIAGNDLSTMSDEIVKILTNKDMISVNQDILGKQGKRIRADGELEVWVKDLAGQRKAVALLNRSNKSADISVHWEEIEMSGKLNVRDLWKHEDLGKYKNMFTGKNIPAHEVMVILLKK